MAESKIETTALEQAQNQLNALIESARTGAIIPVRLPGQLEAIAALLTQASDEHQAVVKSAVQAAQATSGGSELDRNALVDTAEFYKTAIHELRTPMTSIRGYSDMLATMAGDLTDMQKQLLQVVRANSKRMEQLLADMSYINKLRAGILVIANKIDTFKNIAQMVEKKAAPVVQELNRQFELDIPSGLPVLETDGDHLSFALYKLVENGLRYSPEGTGRVTLSAHAEGDTVVISVSDNGVGIAPQDLPKVGTVFFRADSDAVRSHKGSGLGVAIAYQIIDLLDGTHTLQSTPGEGTTFTIRLRGMA
jgi:two-component system phosphate regulon sensor histidine kinase PhoR